MACPDMATDARAMPLTLKAEKTMLSRLATAWANRGRAIVSLRHRWFRKTHETERDIVAQQSCVSATERVNDRPSARTGKQKNLSCPDCIQAQNQQLETMLKFMILAAGGNVDGSTGRNGSTSKR
jgi:hypothetical protein